jgi:hypothetical protein
MPSFHTFNAELAAEFKVPTPSIVLFKSFDDRKVVFDGGDLDQFVEKYQYPSIMNFEYKVTPIGILRLLLASSEAHCPRCSYSTTSTHKKPRSSSDWRPRP